MEELVEILIRLIAALFANKPTKPAPPRRVAPPGLPKAPPPPARIEPSNRAVVTTKMPTAARQPAPAVRKPVRRIPANVAIARPIVTKTAAAPPQRQAAPVQAAPVQAAPVQAAPIQAVAKAAPIKAAAAPNTLPPLTAGSIKKWLNPTTLRQQFMLTEVLQPPLALRDQPRI